MAAPHKRTRSSKTSLTDVAKRAGVSVSTVSRALNGSARVDPETRERIFAAMDRTNYRSRSNPQAFSTASTRLLGFLMPEGMQVMGLDTSVYGDVANAVHTSAEAAGYGVAIGTYTNGSDLVTVGDRLLAQKNIDGAVLYRTRLSDESFDWLRQMQLPFVVIGRLFNRDPFNCVGVDNRQVGYLAAKHLVELGHRRIGFICGPPATAPTVLREEGFRNVMNEAGIPVREDWVREGEYDVGRAVQLTRAMLSSADAPSAIIASNDRTAAAIMRTAQELKLAVPGDVSIIGFDDAQESGHLTPPLTTVRIEWRQMAETATRMLIEILQHQNIDRVFVSIAPRLIVRESTAPPKDRNHENHAS
jgi:DNA-binding LacI/PurR family transcriptional regulator